MTSGPAPAGGTVLLVCTGNICRSPYMAAALSSLLQANGRHDVVLESAGTAALVGAPVAEAMQDIMMTQGLATAGLARQLDPTMLSRADLVLTASREHRSAVVKLRPAALRNTFTLRQAGRLLAGSGETKIDDHVAARRVAQMCAARRGQLGPSPGELDDVPDPWGGPVTEYVASVEAMRRSLSAIAVALTDRGCSPRSTADHWPKVP